jgi:hypothetical protein
MKAKDPAQTAVKATQKAEEPSILKQIAELYEMPIKALKERYQALVPEGSTPSNKDYLIRRIAHKLQEDAFGGLSQPAKARLEVLKKELDPLSDLGQKKTTDGSSRLPLPGTIISKTYKGQLIQVKVLQKGFEYAGKPYRSLSRVAKEVTGVHQSGFVFFGL